MQKIFSIITIGLIYCAAISAVEISYPKDDPIIVTLTSHECFSSWCIGLEGEKIRFSIDIYKSEYTYKSSSGKFTQTNELSEFDHNEILYLIYNISEVCPVTLAFDAKTYNLLKVEGKCNSRASIEDNTFLR